MVGWLVGWLLVGYLVGWLVRLCRSLSLTRRFAANSSHPSEDRKQSDNSNNYNNNNNNRPPAPPARICRPTGTHARQHQPLSVHAILLEYHTLRGCFHMSTRRCVAALLERIHSSLSPSPSPAGVVACTCAWPTTHRSFYRDCFVLRCMLQHIAQRHEGRALRSHPQFVFVAFCFLCRCFGRHVGFCLSLSLLYIACALPRVTVCSFIP